MCQKTQKTLTTKWIKLFIQSYFHVNVSNGIVLRKLSVQESHIKFSALAARKEPIEALNVLVVAFSFWNRSHRTFLVKPRLIARNPTVPRNTMWETLLYRMPRYFKEFTSDTFIYETLTSGQSINRIILRRSVR